MEKWKTIKRWAGLYEISTYGRVRSLDRTVRSRGGTRVIPGRILRQSLGSSGYLQVGLTIRGKGGHKMVHRMVLETFVGPCPNGMEACHGPRGKLDNHLDNLRWGTHQENVAESVAQGIHAYGTRCGNSKLNEEQVAEIRACVGRVPYSELALQFGVSQMTICRAAHGHSWARAGSEPVKGPQHRRKLKKEQVREIRRKAGEGRAHSALARDYDVTQPTITAIVQRRLWAWVE